MFFYTVYNELGNGFLEKVYENALMIELGQNQLFAENQVQVVTYYKNIEVGKYYTDIIAENKIIIESKAHENIRKEDYSQLLHYLKASKIKIGFLVNFGKKPEFKRFVI